MSPGASLFAVVATDAERLVYEQNVCGFTGSRFHQELDDASGPPVGTAKSVFDQTLVGRLLLLPMDFGVTFMKAGDCAGRQTDGFGQDACLNRRVSPGIRSKEGHLADHVARRKVGQDLPLLILQSPDRHRSPANQM